LSIWAEFRKTLNHCDNPFDDVSQFWQDSPRILFNHRVDPFNKKSWPTPWEIIVENRYDDFTLALMMSYTLKFTEKFKNSKIEIKTMVDYSKTKLYNLVFVDDEYILNYDKNNAVKAADIDRELYIENNINV
jgi:hypothetical protein